MENARCIVKKYSVSLLLLLVGGFLLRGVSYAASDYEESEYILSICSANLYCPTEFENKQIEKYSSQVNRSDLGVSLNLDSKINAKIVLKDNLENGEGYAKFTFISYFPNTAQYLVKKQQYEGVVLMYIDATNGSVEFTPSFRQYAPGEKSYAISFVDIDFEFPNNWISIMVLDSEGWNRHLILRYHPEEGRGERPKYIGPKAIKWVNEHKIEIDEISSVHDGKSPDVIMKAYLVSKDGVWAYQGGARNVTLKQY